MKYLRKRILDRWNTYEKKFCTHEIPWEKILDPQNSREKKNFWTHGRMMMLWYETNEIRDGTRFMEFITLDLD